MVLSHDNSVLQRERPRVCDGAVGGGGDVAMLLWLLQHKTQ